MRFVFHITNKYRLQNIKRLKQTKTSLFRKYFRRNKHPIKNVGKSDETINDKNEMLKTTKATHIKNIFIYLRLVLYWLNVDEFCLMFEANLYIHRASLY